MGGGVCREEPRQAWDRSDVPLIELEASCSTSRDMSRVYDDTLCQPNPRSCALKWSGATGRSLSISPRDGSLA